MQPNHPIDHDDHDMQWLAREAPQFHTHIEPSRPLPASYSAPEDCDDASSTSSDDSAGSDSDDDPYHPYNFHNPTEKWVRDGDFVYAADDLQEDYLSTSPHVNADAPYIPADQAGKAQQSALFLSTSDLTPSTLCDEPYVYRDANPRVQPETLSPLELTSSPAPSPERASTPHDASRARRARAPTRRSTARTAHDAYILGSDDEDGMSSGDDASEDEYVPSPRIRTRRLPLSSRSQPSGKVKTRAALRLSYSPYPSSSASTSAGESSLSNPRRPGSRNIQIIDQAPPPRGSWPKTGPDAYKCPYCDHVQKNKRSPDMERHIRSHFRRTAQAQWVCCGLPLEEAMIRGRGRDDNPWKFNGVLMVGGCHEDFSRMDALKRHWRNANNSCVGDIRYARVQEEESSQ
ncbi:hypothetical protein GY45DRAFT_1267322 [Cubamyces sp. BRFM 1775]|nr:hypothetical protein GY45DRAFT_1267322 [Cubamyces sp. BRFM 1775]